MIIDKEKCVEADKRHHRQDIEMTVTMSYREKDHRLEVLYVYSAKGYSPAEQLKRLRRIVRVKLSEK